MSDYYKQVTDGALFYSPLLTRLIAARQHAEKHGDLDAPLWPYEKFATTTKELLDAAIKGCKP